jgi:hypothetical protein
MPEIKVPSNKVFYRSNNIVAEIRFSPSLEQQLNEDFVL